MKERPTLLRYIAPCVLIAIALFLLLSPINPKMPQVATRVLYVVFLAGGVVSFLYERSEIRRLRQEEAKKEQSNNDPPA